MNKKGFTLIELLATIGLLTLIGVMIGVNITSILRSTKKNNKDFEKTQIEKAACVYVDSETLCANVKNGGNCDSSVTVAKLISSGLLDSKTYSSKTASITVTRNSSGKKVCKYNGS